MKRACFAVAWALAACGAPTPPPGAAPEPSASPTPSPEPVAPPESSAEPGAATSAEPSAEPAPEPVPDTTPREVKYVMTGGKLDVVIDGVRFKPSAKAIRVGGGWGLRLTISGEAEDDKMHSLLAGKHGVLAFGGTLTRKGQTEKLEDERGGDEEVLVSPGTAAKLEREWPGKGGPKPLASGDKLELRVGLWGFGPDAASRKPVKKFLIVSMSVGKGEPRALIAPPK